MRTPVLLLALLSACTGSRDLPADRGAADVVGLYVGPAGRVLALRTHGGRLYAAPGDSTEYLLTRVSENVYSFPETGRHAGETVRIVRDDDQKAQTAQQGADRFDRAPQDTPTFRITPLRPIAELREEAMRATPPPEGGDRLAPDLVELHSLEPELLYDIRYASDNNFMGEPFYREPRAFLQRPAAEAVVAAHRELAAHGYGLVIYDAYRPWYVTKMFWEATPPGLREFVANPANGSRHNRGAAVDVGLYDLASGAIVPMPSGYDEFTERAYSSYGGGNAPARVRRDLLREVMERHGFIIYTSEWWHFDYADWDRYPILNEPFDALR